MEIPSVCTCILYTWETTTTMQSNKTVPNIKSAGVSSALYITHVIHDNQYHV